MWADISCTTTKNRPNLCNFPLPGDDATTQLTDPVLMIDDSKLALKIGEEFNEQTLVLLVDGSKFALHLSSLHSLSSRNPMVDKAFGAPKITMTFEVNA